MASKQLRLCEYNIENLFLSMEYYDGQNLEQVSEAEWAGFALAQFRRKQKPLRKLWGLASAMLDIDPDIFLLVEVGGPDSLANFNRHFLGGRYVPHFVEGNSKRNIDLGFLVKRDLGLTAETRSNRHLPIEVHAYQGRYETRFSRDVAQLCLFDGDTHRLTLLLTHLKSRISTDQDMHGRDVRSAEAAALAGLYHSLRKNDPGVPVVLGGDFNAGLESPELRPLGATDLTDLHEILGTPTAERVSLVHFEHTGAARPQALDHFLVSPELIPHVRHQQSGVYRYKSFYDVAEPLPETLQERWRLPSDHYPLVLTLELPATAAGLGGATK